MSEIDKVFNKIKNGVYVLTTSLHGKDYGMTISWCTKASKNPNMVAVSIGKNRKEYNRIKESEMFAINILGEEHIEIGRHFGISTEDNVDNFKDVEISRLDTGCPILEASVGALDCELIKEVDAGDHVIFIGKVINFAEKDGETLIFDKKDFP